MNLLYRTPASAGGSNAKCLKALDEKIHFNKCVVVDQSAGEADIYRGKKYVKISAEAGYSCQYDDILDTNKISALNRELLESMEKYKSTCLNMSIRNYNMYIGNYYEMESEYLTHLKFWNYIFENNDIDFVFLATIPHHMWEYTVYALAKCKKIPVLLVGPSHISGLAMVGTSIDNMGINMVNMCQSKINLKRTELHEIVEEYYNKSSKNHSCLSGKDKKQRRKDYFYRFCYRNYYKPLIEKISREFDSYSLLKKDIGILMRIVYKRLKLVSISYYDRKAVSKVRDKKFVCFFLHLTPELTTLPWGGVFQNQLLAVRLLAQELEKKNIKLYVKEHWVQLYREKEFYDELLSIPNVVCIKSSVDSYKLLKKSIAVATITGTIISEAIIHKKPVITFTKSYWSGMDSVLFVNDCKDISKFINYVLDGKIVISDNDVKRYFLAHENGMVRFLLDLDDNAKICLKDVQMDIVGLISKFIDEGLPEKFYYIREK